MVQLRLLVTALLLLTAMTSSSVAQEVDYFVVRIPPADGNYDPDQVVSREAIPNNAWYQMDSDWRVVVDAESEAYIVSDARPGATYDGARIVGMKPRGKAIEGTVYALLRSREDNQKSVLVRPRFKSPRNQTSLHREMSSWSPREGTMSDSGLSSMQVLRSGVILRLLRFKRQARKLRTSVRDGRWGPQAAQIQLLH